MRKFTIGNEQNEQEIVIGVLVIGILVKPVKSVKRIVILNVEF